MKKIVYILVLVVAIVLIASRTTSQNALAENNTRPAASNDTKVDANLPVSESAPKILFLVNSESKGSPALWWSFKQENKDGC